MSIMIGSIFPSNIAPVIHILISFYLLQSHFFPHRPSQILDFISINSRILSSRVGESISTTWNERAFLRWNASPIQGATITNFFDIKRFIYHFNCHSRCGCRIELCTSQKMRCNLLDAWKMQSWIYCAIANESVVKTKCSVIRFNFNFNIILLRLLADVFI